MLTSTIWAPFSTCWRATSSAVSKSPSRMSLANRAEPVTLVRSPTLTNSEVGSIGEGLEAAQAAHRRAACGARGGQAGDRVGDRFDMRRSGPAAAAHQVDEAGLGELSQHRPHLFRRLVVAAEGVGKAGVGVATHEGFAAARDLLDVRAQLCRAERAVEPHDQGVGMGDRIDEGLGVWPVSVRPLASVIVPEIMIGRCNAPLVETPTGRRKSRPCS